MPPYDVTIGPEMYDVYLDQRISLPCIIDSYPPPTIVWKKDGQELSPDDDVYVQREYSLDIAQARVTHSGVYECVATNPAGNVTRTMTVHVMGRWLVVCLLAPSFPCSVRQVVRPTNSARVHIV